MSTTKERIIMNKRQKLELAFRQHTKEVLGENAVKEFAGSELEALCVTFIQKQGQSLPSIEHLSKGNSALVSVINWVAFDFMKLETRPPKYDKYLICRKDGKIHWETWNGSGWAYNHKEIRFWARIEPPCL